jgi:hypothetical protein
MIMLWNTFDSSGSSFTGVVGCVSVVPLEPVQCYLAMRDRVVDSQIWALEPHEVIIQGEE